MRSGLNTVARWLRPGRTAILTVIGLGCLSAAAWIQLGLAAGVAGIGVSALIVEALGERR